MSSKERFGSYEVLQHEDGSNIVLGKGGFGRIYKARHNILGRIAALKVIKEESLHAGASGDRDKIIDFKSEARAVAKLNHPGIAHIHECASEDGVFYQATEYCEGGTLQEYCDRYGPIPWEAARPMVIKILEGLEYAHANGVVHRDIKPANIMLAKAGSLGEPKIIDFGLARSLATEDIDPTATLRGSAVDAGGLTPVTASPEQLRSAQDQPPDERTDLFSLGVSIWWVLLGKNPFADLKTGPLYVDRLSPASYESRLPDDFHAEARQILLLLLEKDRNKRAPSATRVLELLGARESPRENSSVVPEPGVHEIELLPVPPAFEDGWSSGKLIRSVPHAKLYEAWRTGDSMPGVAVNVGFDMDVRLLAGMRLAAAKRVDMGAFLFLDWRLSGNDDVFILTPPSGCSLLAVLRKVGSSGFRDALPFFVRLARSYDTASAWLGCGIQIDPADILVRHNDGRSDPDAFRTWGDIDPVSPSCLPLFDDGGEVVSSTEATISTSTQGFPPLARFAALVYRVVSGGAVSHAAFYTESGYVMASGFSEDGNSLIRDALCDSHPSTPLSHFLQMLAGLESQQVGEITHLLPPPAPLEIAAEIERERGRRTRAAAEKKAAEEAAVREVSLRRQAEEAAKAAEIETARLKAEQELEALRLVEAAAALKAAEESAAAEKEQTRREQEWLLEKQEREKRDAEVAAQAARLAEAQAAKDAEIIRAVAQKKREEAAAESERQLIAQQNEEIRKNEENRINEERLAAERAESERLAAIKKANEDAAAIRVPENEEKRAAAALVAVTKANENAAKERAAELRVREKEAARAAKLKKKDSSARNQGPADPKQGAKTKIVIIACSIVALLAIVFGFMLRDHGKSTASAGKPPASAPKPDPVIAPVVPPVVEQAPQPPPIEPVPVAPKRPEKPKTVLVKFIMLGAPGTGYPCDSFELTTVVDTGEKYPSASGAVEIQGKPGAEYKLTLLGTVAGKKDTPLASRLVRLPAEASESLLEVSIPASLPVIQIDNPHDYADYSLVSVSPPPDLPSKPTTESAANLKGGSRENITIMKFTPEVALWNAQEKSFPAKGKTTDFPVVGNGKWTVTYSGSQLGDKAEEFFIEGNNLTYSKTTPKPYSGKYSIVVPMTKFPNRPDKRGQWATTNDPPVKEEISGFYRVPYHNELVYCEKSKSEDYQDGRNGIAKAVSEESPELPHYVGLVIDLDLRSIGLSSGNRAYVLWAYPVPMVVHSSCVIRSVTFRNAGDIGIVMYSDQTFAGGKGSEVDKWVGDFVGTVKPGGNFGEFMKNSVKKWTDYFVAPEVRRASIPNDMKISEWKITETEPLYKTPYHVRLRMGDGSLELREFFVECDLKQLFIPWEKAPEGAKVAGVFFDAQVTPSRIPAMMLPHK